MQLQGKTISGPPFQIINGMYISDCYCVLLICGLILRGKLFKYGNRMVSSGYKVLLIEQCLWTFRKDRLPKTPQICGLQPFFLTLSSFTRPAATSDQSGRCYDTHLPLPKKAQVEKISQGRNNYAHFTSTVHIF